MPFIMLAMIDHVLKNAFRLTYVNFIYLFKCIGVYIRGVTHKKAE